MRALLKLNPQQKITYTSLILRFALAFTLLYAGLSALGDTDLWVGFIPSFVGDIIDPTVVLDVISVAQVLLALWLIWGKCARLAALGALALLAGIVLANLGSLFITFRDIGLAGLAIGVFLLEDK